MMAYDLKTAEAEIVANMLDNVTKLAINMKD